MRKIIIGLAAAAVVALALPTLSTDASARGWGHHGGGWHGGGWHGGWRGGGWGRGYYAPYYAYYPGYSCWRSIRAWGPYGWYWRRVWVCG